SPLLAEKYIAAAKTIVESAVPKVSKVLPIKNLTATPAKNKLTFTSGGKLSYKFKVDKPGDYLLVAEVEVRGSFEFDNSRVQLVVKVDGEETVKEEHGWLNSKKFRHETKGQWKPGEEHRVELEVTPLPPANIKI